MSLPAVADLYARNIGSLALRDKRTAMVVSDASLDDVRVEEEGGALSATRPDGRRIRLTSMVDPRGEAERLLEGGYDTGSNFVICLGAGNLELFELLLDRVDPEARLVVIERRADVLRRALELRDFSRLLGDARVEWYVGFEEKEVGRKLAADGPRMALQRVCVVEHPASVSLSSDYYAALRQEILGILRIELSTAATWREGKEAFFNNLLVNLKRVAETPGVNELYGSFKGVPAVLVSAGPSLTEQLEPLRRAQGRALIIAVDTAMRTLLEAGIHPDIAVAIDFTPTNLRHFEGVDTSKITLVAAPTVYPKCLDRHTGPLFAIQAEHPLMDWLSPMIGERGAVPVGNSTAHTAFHLAEAMGCDPVLLAGQDLAFIDEVTHAKGVATRIHVDESSDTEELVWVDTNDGKRARTSYSLYTILRRFEERIGGSAVKTVNTTLRGAKIGGTSVMPLEEALDKFGVGHLDAREVLRPASTKLPPVRWRDLSKQARNARWRLLRLRRLAKSGMRVVERLFDRLCGDRLAFDAIRDEITELDRVYALVHKDSQMLDVLQSGLEGALSRLRFSSAKSGAPGRHDFTQELLKDRQLFADLRSATRVFAKLLRRYVPDFEQEDSAASKMTDEWMRRRAVGAGRA